jgi:hypothetical protein
MTSQVGKLACGAAAADGFSLGSGAVVIDVAVPSSCLKKFSSFGAAFKATMLKWILARW